MSAVSRSSTPRTPAAAQAEVEVLRDTRPVRSAAELVAVVTGTIFLVVGVVGLLPGLTVEFGDVWFSAESAAVGPVQLSAMHHLTYLLVGMAGVLASLRHRTSWAYLILGGIAYSLLFGYGLATDPGLGAGTWLHLALALMMIIAGTATRREPSAGSTR